MCVEQKLRSILIESRTVGFTRAQEQIMSLLRDLTFSKVTQMTGNNAPRVIDGIKHANELASKGETESAVRYLLALIEKVPTAASLHGYAAIFMSREGRHNEAIEHGRKAVQWSPTSEKASFVLV